MSPFRDYVVWSQRHHGWLSGDGFCRNLQSATLFDRTSAIEVAKDSRSGWADYGCPEEIAVPLVDAEECSGVIHGH